MAVIYDKEKYSVEISESKEGVSGYRFIQNDKKLENIFFVEKALYEADEKDVLIKISDSTLQSVSFLLRNQVPPKGIKVEITDNELLALGEFHLGNGCEVKIANNRGESYFCNDKYLVDDEGKFVFTNNHNVSLSVRHPFSEEIPSFKLLSLNNSYSYKSYDFPAVRLNFPHNTKNNEVNVDGLEILDAMVWSKYGIYLQIESPEDGSKALIKDVRGFLGVQVEAYDNVEIRNVKLEGWNILKLQSNGNTNVSVSNYTGEYGSNLELSVNPLGFSEKGKSEIRLVNCTSAKNSKLYINTDARNVILEDIGSLNAIGSSTYSGKSPSTAIVNSSYNVSIQRVGDLKLFGELKTSSFLIRDVQRVEIELNKKEDNVVLNESKGNSSVEIEGAKEVVFRADSDNFYGQLFIKAANNGSIIAHNVKTSNEDTMVYLNVKGNETVVLNNVDVEKYLYTEGNVIAENVSIKDYSALKAIDSIFKNCDFKGAMTALCDVEAENSSLRDVTIDPSEITPHRTGNPTSLDDETHEYDVVVIKDSEISDSKIYGYAAIRSSVISNIYAIDSVSAEYADYFGNNTPVSGFLSSKDRPTTKQSRKVENIRADKKWEVEL